eukprot:10005244-Alexandrium_andersonii.AAC.1
MPLPGRAARRGPRPRGRRAAEVAQQLWPFAGANKLRRRKPSPPRAAAPAGSRARARSAASSRSEGPSSGRPRVCSSTRICSPTSSALSSGSIASPATDA